MLKKQFRGYHRGQVDDLLNSMEKDKERQLLDLKQEIAACLRHNHDLVQEIEKIVSDIENTHPNKFTKGKQFTFHDTNDIYLFLE